MKQCPVCKENFADEFSFCDLDGTQLDGDSKLPSASGSSGAAGKVWPIVGVVLVLGALATVVGSIVFFPRGLSAPPPIGQSQSQATVPVKSGAGASSSSSTDTTQTASALPPSDSQDAAKPTKGADSADPALAGLRANANAKKNAGLHDQNPADPSLDPKAALRPATELQPANAGDETARTLKTPANASDSRPPSREAAETSGADSSATGTTGTGTTVGQTKRRTARASTADGEDPTSSKNSKKKKGGFLKIFKKIFGQG